MNIFKLTVLLLNFFIVNSIRFKGLRLLSKSFSIGITSLIITSNCPFPASAVIDCQKDCQMNCVRVAPGSESYCKATCSEYCDQTDRQDGLSGSIDASKGETGIFGGSIDGTVTRGDDRPPTGFDIIPRDMMKNLQIKTKPQEPRKGVYFKEIFNANN